LDEKDRPLEAIKAYRDMTQLVSDRNLCWQHRLEALVKYPPVDGNETLPKGPWPGAVEWLSLSKSNPVFVVQKQLLGKEFHVVGTWDATPILDDEDYKEGSSMLAAFWEKDWPKTVLMMTNLEMTGVHFLHAKDQIAIFLD
jgi:hypothetical protein